MTEFITADALSALLQVVLIDLVLAGDNAVVIGLAAAGLPAEQRRRAIVVGIVAATALRIVFAGVATQLLQVIGLLLAGGVLLLWVCWKMWRELREHAAHANQLAAERNQRDEEVAELLSYRLVIIAFSVGVDAEGDLLAIHVSQPILTDFERSALDVHQSGITVAEGVQTDALNSLLDA